MKLPIELLKQVDDWGLQLDCEYSLTDRQIAIKEAIRLLVSLTHDEYYHQDDPYDEYYSTVAATCATLSEH